MPATAQPKRPTTKRRYKLIKAAFVNLYQVKRRRLDDATKAVCDQYGISEATLWRAVKSEPENPSR